MSLGGENIYKNSLKQGELCKSNTRSQCSRTWKTTNEYPNEGHVKNSSVGIGRSVYD